MTASRVEITVVVPAYNAARTIGRLLEMLGAQTFQSFEVQVVDDGSTDGTAERLASAGTPWLRWASQENSGPGAARNRGVQLATGRWIAFIDSDDEIAPEWLQDLHDAVSARPGLRLGCCGLRFVDVGTGRESARLPRPMGRLYGGMTGQFLSGSYLVERSLFLEVGGFAADLRYGENHELAMRLGRVVTPVEVGLTDRTPLRVLHDRSPQTVARYDRHRLAGAEYVLRVHRDLFVHDPVQASNRHGVAGVAAARLGEYGRARGHFWAAMQHAEGRRVVHAGRLALACVPPLARRYWRRSA